MEKGTMKKSTTRRALRGHSAQWRCADAATPTRRLAWPPSPQQRSSFDGASFAAFAFSELQMHVLDENNASMDESIPPLTPFLFGL
jgi:hypothetical protein